MSSVFLALAERDLAGPAAASARRDRSELIRWIISLLSGLPGDDRADLDGHFAAIEPQIGLARSAIRPVAAEAIGRQNRPHVAIVLHVVGPARGAASSNHAIANPSIRGDAGTPATNGCFLGIFCTSLFSR